MAAGDHGLVDKTRLQESVRFNNTTCIVSKKYEVKNEKKKTATKTSKLYPHYEIIE